MGYLAASFLVGFLLGSIPAAWILVRLHVKQDLARSGSTNVGALNALRVSRSKWIGVLVLVLDALKGATAVWLATAMGAHRDVATLSLQGAAAVGAVAGHNYNPWLSLAAGKLAGGKGLAAAAGALFAFLPWLVVVWLGVGLVAWFVFKAWRGIKDETPASAVATIAIVPGAALIYGGCATIIAVGFVLLILPKLVRELRALFFSAGGSSEAD